MTTTTELTTAQLETAKKDLQTTQAKYIEGLQKEGNQALLKEVHPLQLGDAYGASGTLSVESYVIYSVVTADITYTDSGKKFHFDGRAWGIGAGAITSLGGGPFVGPDVLVGDCRFHVQFASSGGGVANATWWRDDFGALASFTGAAIGAGATEMGGWGTWTAA